VINVPQYRITPEDLVDADKKTARALGPLLDALNRTLPGTIASLVALENPSLMSVSFTTDNAGAATVKLGPGAPMSELWVTALLPKTGTLTTAWSMSWIAQPKGARLLFQGLAHLTTYSLKVRYF